MKTALIQTNPIIGHFEYNLGLLLDRLRQAEQAGCELAIFPELALCGYPPQDLLERHDFLQAHDRALDKLIAAVDETGVMVGAVEQRIGPGKRLNAITSNWQCGLFSALNIIVSSREFLGLRPKLQLSAMRFGSI